MTTKDECCLCSPDFGADTVCDECKDKAAGYDDLRLRMECVGRALRRMLGQVDPTSLTRYEIETQLATNCAPELARGDAREARVEEWRRQSDSASLHKAEARP